MRDRTAKVSGDRQRRQAETLEIKLDRQRSIRSSRPPVGFIGRQRGDSILQMYDVTDELPWYGFSTAHAPSINRVDTKTQVFRAQNQLAVRCYVVHCALTVATFLFLPMT